MGTTIATPIMAKPWLDEIAGCTTRLLVGPCVVENYRDAYATHVGYIAPVKITLPFYDGSAWRVDIGPCLAHESKIVRPGFAKYWSLVDDDRERLFASYMMDVEGHGIRVTVGVTLQLGKFYIRIPS